MNHAMQSISSTIHDMTYLDLEIVDIVHKNKKASEIWRIDGFLSNNFKQSHSRVT